MIITKSDLKNIILEEINHVLCEAREEYLEKKVIFSLKSFLELTTDENAYPLSDLRKRLEVAEKKISSQGKNIKDVFNSTTMSLVVNSKGKVTNHEGRMRAFYYAGRPESLDDLTGQETAKIIFNYSSLLDPTQKELKLYHQFVNDKFVIVDNPIYDANAEQPANPFNDILSSLESIMQEEKSGYGKNAEYHAQELLPEIKEFKNNNPQEYQEIKNQIIDYANQAINAAVNLLQNLGEQQAAQQIQQKEKQSAENFWGTLDQCAIQLKQLVTNDSGEKILNSIFRKLDLLETLTLESPWLKDYKNDVRQLFKTLDNLQNDYGIYKHIGEYEDDADSSEHELNDERADYKERIEYIIQKFIEKYKYMRAQDYLIQKFNL